MKEEPTHIDIETGALVFPSGYKESSIRLATKKDLDIHKQHNDKALVKSIREIKFAGWTIEEVAAHFEERLSKLEKQSNFAQI